MPVSETQDDPWLKPVAAPKAQEADPWLAPVAAPKQESDDPWLAPVRETQAAPEPVAQAVAESPKYEPKPSLFTAANVVAEQILSQPQGQLGAAQAVVDARTGADEGVTGMLSWLRRVGQLAFPKTGGHPPTSLEFDELSRRNPDIAPLWQQINHERELSYQRAKALGDKPDWEAAQKQHLDKVYAAVEMARADGKRERDGIPDPRDSDAMLKLAFQMAVPGVDRPPITGTEAADTAWQALKAQKSQDIDALPWWLTRGLRAVAEGGKFAGLIATGVGESPAALGFGSEAGSQALGVASGQRTELEPGQILISTLLMKGSAKAGEMAKAAGYGAVRQTAASIGVFEAAAGAQKFVESQKPGGEGEKHGVLRQIVEHIIDVVGTAGVASLAGHGKPKDFVVEEAPPNQRVPLSEFRKAYREGREPVVEDPFLQGTPTDYARFKVDQFGEAADAEVPPLDKGLKYSEGETPRAEVAKTPGRINYEASKIAHAEVMKKIKRVFGSRGEEERFVEREKKIEAEVIPAVAALNEAVYKHERALKKAAPGDPELQAKLDRATRIVVESEGKIPVPEVTVLPQAFTKVVDTQMKIGEAALGIGNLLEKYGAIPYARYQQPGKTSNIIVKRGEEPPPGAELKGGLKFHEERGHFFPRVGAGEEVPEFTPSVRGNKEIAPLSEERIAGHLKKRTKTFDEDFAARPLDLSYQKAYEILLGESRLVRKQAHLDLARLEGDALTTSEVPGVRERETARAKAEQVGKDIKLKRQQAKGLTPEDQLRAFQEIGGLQRERRKLEMESKQSTYKELAGKEWGQFEGMWLHKDAFNRVRFNDALESQWGAFGRSLNNKFKATKIGMNPALAIPDKIGNAVQARLTGLNTIREGGHSIKVNFGRGEKDSLDHLFDAFAQRMSAGGNTDLSPFESRKFKDLNRKIEELNRQGHTAVGYRLAQILESREMLVGKMNEFLAKRLPGAGPFTKIPGALINGMAKIPHWRQLLVDGADARAAFRDAVKRGIDGSGPLKPHEAFEEVRGVFDYRTLPRWVNAAANFPLGPTLIRFPAKVIQGAMTGAMRRRPSLFGAKVPLSMDPASRLIAADPTSTGAQAALVARGMLRLATTGAEPIALLYGAQQGARIALGISQKELDQDLEDRFGFLPGPLAWLLKQSFIPMGRDAYGHIDGVDGAQGVPGLVAWRYFSQAFEPRDIGKDPGGFIRDVLFQLSQKNMIGGAAVRALTGKGSQGKATLAEGFGPGSSSWEVAKLAVPAFILKPLEEYFQQQNVPEEERSVMRNILRTIVGLPMTVLPKRGQNARDILRQTVERYYREGVVGIKARSGGGFEYYVLNPDTIDGVQASDAVRLYYSPNTKGDIQYELRKQHRIMQQKLNERD